MSVLYVQPITDKARAALKRLAELDFLLGAPEIIADKRLYKKYADEYMALSPLLDDLELLTITDADDAMFMPLLQKTACGLRRLDAADKPHEICIIEIEGAGEAARQLQEAYEIFAKLNGYKFIKATPIDANDTKNAVRLTGAGAYAVLARECGLHKITDTGGKGYTLYVRVYPLPPPPSIQPKDNQIKIETFRAGGAGGQHVNKTDSAVRATHTATGISVICQDERSQLQNKMAALNALNKKVSAYYRQKGANEFELSKKIADDTVKKGIIARTYDIAGGATLNETAELAAVVIGGDIKIL